ncbi:hypothetical protein A9Z64_03770 [Moraxella osloensis]|uniref:Lipopolysaccharide core biosynthesis protein n=1 Tax=Faucicola osloensis TaxID=34062 RepID=A0A378QAC2_FAUOS|nr:MULTISPECIES: hypothetical protein [Moraxella]HCN15293.1 hypothetical protein [Moraxellaceae bacterium]AME00404.1 hypothetical protein AXE82_00340 [Moraxella osloensis]OBX51312.1 hypothetical protein A9Z64_03770 [Moraxella osloensis]QPT42014.1 hypothetical protein I6G27_08505 [Moraxella osloensis]STY97622.1 lipopolysaccharide core biosynthesis protein [Moraxella osloensis]
MNLIGAWGQRVANNQFKLPNNINIAIVDSEFDNTYLTLPPQKSVNILASGSSIHSANLNKISQQPCIFVNGSIELMETYDFQQPVAYVITDPRFIRHNLAILQNRYHGQCPLYITQTVLEKLADTDRNLIKKYVQHLRLIYSVERPIRQPSKHFLAKFFRKNNKRLLMDFANHPQFVIEGHGDTTIGVSLDISHGFVEAGTVAFVATQLAYRLGFSEIHLYGIDLINAHEPRFYENVQNSAPSKLAPAIYNRIVPSFDLLASVYQQQGVMVYNHSPVSKDLFKNLPFFD